MRKEEQGPIWEAVAVVSVIDMRCCTKVMGRERAQTEDTGPNQHPISVCRWELRDEKGPEDSTNFLINRNQKVRRRSLVRRRW